MLRWILIGMGRTLYVPCIYVDLCVVDHRTHFHRNLTPCKCCCTSRSWNYQSSGSHNGRPPQHRSFVGHICPQNRQLFLSVSKSAHVPLQQLICRANARSRTYNPRLRCTAAWSEWRERKRLLPLIYFYSFNYKAAWSCKNIWKVSLTLVL